MKVRLYDQDFEITDSMLTAGRFLVKNVVPLAESATKKIGNAYDEYGNLENAATKIFNLKESVYQTTAKHYVDLLHQNNLRDYDYQIEDFMSDLHSAFGGAYIDELCEMLEKYYDILANDKTFAEYQRDLRKATRGRFYGYNLSSSAVAGSLNLFSGAVHSIFNAIDGAITNSEIDDKMDAVYKECKDAIWYCTFGDAYNMGILFLNIANLDNFYIENENRARKIQKAIDEGQVPKNKLNEKVAQVLFLMPQYKENYIWAFKLLGDDYYKLIKYAEVFEQKDAVKEIYGAMAELEVQKKKHQQELKLKAEKIASDKIRQDELKKSAKKLFGDNAEEFDKLYANNRFYSIFLDTSGGVLTDEFCKKICNSFEKFSKYTKYIWGRDNFYFERKFNDELKEIFDKFKFPPPTLSDALIMVSCDEYFNTILFTGQKIYFVNTSEKPLVFSYDEIKNFRYVRKEGVMTYNDYMNVNGNDVIEIGFDEDVFNAVKDILEILKLKISYQASKTSTTPISISEFKADLRDNYNFNSCVYYNYANDEKAQKKFSAAVDSYAKLSSGEEPLVLFDSTLFGSAKDGFILTNKGFHSHGIGIDKFIPYDRLGVAQDTADKHQIIKINAVKIDTIPLKDDDIEKLAKVIRKCREYFTSQKNSALPKTENIVDKILFDATPPELKERVTARKENSTPKELSRQDLTNFINRLQDKYNFKSHVYYYNHDGKLDKKIEKKFKAALESYAKLTPNEFPIFLFDSTLFGSATEGFMLTNKGIHIRNISENPVFIEYNHNFAGLRNDKITVGITELSTGTLADDKKRALLNLINECRDFFIKVKAAPEIDKNKIQNFIRQLQENFYFRSHIYYYNHDGKLDKKIEKKFKAALESYAKLELDEIPVVLFDSTLFGSATDGFILTNKGIHSHKSNTIFISYENLSSVSRNDDCVTINSTETDTGFLSDADKNDLIVFIKTCRDFFTGKIQRIEKTPMPYENP